MHTKMESEPKLPTPKTVQNQPTKNRLGLVECARNLSCTSAKNTQSALDTCDPQGGSFVRVT